jgi:hypothetical protein
MTPARNRFRKHFHLESSGCHRCGASEPPEVTPIPGGVIARCRTCGLDWTRHSGPKCVTCGGRELLERLSTPEHPLYPSGGGCRVVSLCTTCDKHLLEPEHQPDRRVSRPLAPDRSSGSHVEENCVASDAED